jgi:hypothetical protein
MRKKIKALEDKAEKAPLACQFAFICRPPILGMANIFATEVNFPALWTLKPIQTAKESCFARTRSADDGYGLTLADINIDTVKNDTVTILL